MSSAAKAREIEATVRSVMDTTKAILLSTNAYLTL